MTPEERADAFPPIPHPLAERLVALMRADADDAVGPLSRLRPPTGGAAPSAPRSPRSSA